MSLVDYATAARRRTSNWRTRCVQPGLLLAWAVMIVAALMAIAPQLFTTYSPLEGFPGAQRLAPQAGHWLGTDQLGRDLWSRIVFGAVHSLSAALAAVAIGLFIGTALGTLAGALAGRVESAIMRLVDVLLAILFIAVADGHHSARFRHAQRRRRGRRGGRRQLCPPGASGGGPRTPQRLSKRPTAAAAPFSPFSGGIFCPRKLRVESARMAWPNWRVAKASTAVSELGRICRQKTAKKVPPVPEWGLLIAEGRNYLSTAWWLTTLPGIAVIAVVLAANRISRQFSGERR